MRVDRWSFDDSGYYAYLVVDCDAADFEKLKTLLKERHFSVLAAGTSFRPAADGRQYRYYLRLGTPVDGRHEKPSKESVVDALKFAQALSPEPPAAHPLRDISDLLAEIAQLKIELAEQTRTLREVAERTRSVETQTSKRWEAFQEGLRQAGARQREDHTLIVESIVSALDTKLGDDERVRQLQKSIEELGQSERDCFSYCEELKKESASKDQLIESLRQQIECTTRGQTHSEHPKASRQSQAGVFAACLPTVNLIRGCEDILFFEYGDPTKAIRQISKLVIEPGQVKAETVEGARGWFELRSSTGNDKNGRLYFRRENGRVDVLVSTKQEQDADIRYLRDHT